jgi:porin
MIRTTLLIAFLISLQIEIKGQQGNPFTTKTTIADTALAFSTNNFLTHEVSYLGDFVNNFRGGIKQGSMYLGIAHINLGFETKNIGLWNGGEFFIHGASTHGGTPSSDLIGDFQVASNIEAGNHTYIQELWYKQSFDNYEIKIGLQDLNTEFVVSEFSSDFLNSSFGVPSVISDNIPVPIFPLTAIGVMGKFKLAEDVSLSTALYDGMPEAFEHNEYNLNWSLDKEHGLLFFSELELPSPINNLPGTIKIGGYYHSHLNEFNNETNDYKTVFSSNYGIYFISDQTIWQNTDGNKLGLFTQLAVSPANINTHNYYLGGGINYSGIFNNDAFGLAFAVAGFNNYEIKNETTIEIFYKKEITQNLFLQPDVQYIINPAGTEQNLNNSLAAFIRFGINF